MKFRTEIEIDRSSLQIDHHHRILTLGSCFAEHMAMYFRRYRFRVLENPFGVLYNPASITNALGLLKSGRELSREDLVQHQDEWHSFHFDSFFSGSQPDACLKQQNNALRDARAFIALADVVMITYGTSFIYTYKPTGQIVSNCHKIPAKAFDHRILQLDESVELIESSLRMIREMNGNASVILTVSPVRHWKHGAVDNQISKAGLLLAVNRIVNDHQNVFYFPSYEIIMDDLRDYRFYEADLLHPNRMATDYIWEKFKHAYISNDAQGVMQQLEPLIKAREHRPGNPLSAHHLNFVKNQMLQIQQLKLTFPHLDLSEDQEYFTQQHTESNGTVKKSEE